jgi:metal-responsive CopG/Arc/MetJ family transcriptional regulator
MQSVQIRLPTPMIAWIDKMAHTLGWSRSEMIRAAIEGGRAEVEKP